MAHSIFHGIKIAAVAAAVPPTVINNTEAFTPLFGVDALRRFIDVTGIEEFRRAPREQTASDLCFAAAERILTDKNIDRGQVGALIFVTETPDYPAPSTAFILAHRLGLPTACMPFDVNLGCTGYVYGLQIAASILQSIGEKYALLLVGDVLKLDNLESRPHPDHSYVMMFGDAGSATLLEKDEAAPPIDVELYSDASDFKVLFTPAGGTRMPDAPKEATEWSDGISRSLYDPYMDGMAVFAFATKTAPDTMQDFMAKHGTTPDDYDALVLHQPNKLIIERIAKKMRLPLGKFPISLARYGNTNCGSIPVTLVDRYGDNENKNAAPLDLLLCGFGVGLSWGALSLTIDTFAILPMIVTSEIYEHGSFEPT